MTLIADLDALARQHKMLGKGFLGLALIITDQAKVRLPLDPDKMMTEGGGQVKGASGARVQAILAEAGIDRRLSSEGGRTSRGTPAKMRAYVAFLNERATNVDLDEVHGYWIDRVRDFFAGKPFILDLDPAVGVTGSLRGLIAKVRARESETPGVTLTGTVIQHLIGAKLEIALNVEAGSIARHGASVNDASGRGGDLELEDTVIHITTMPGQLLIEKCAANIKAGLRPMVITGRERTKTAQDIIADHGLADRVDVLDYEQFLTTNIFELGRFAPKGRRDAFGRIIDRYNEIIDRVESDPGLKIEIKG
ncbi:MAG: DUF4928 family protein [Proteobacteria bacterium]|nr:DUF4928 family protein [Pseudomonadota bacterium]